MPPPPAPVRHPPLGTSNSFLASAHNTPLSSSHGPAGRKRDRDRAERERERERDSKSAAASDADADGEMEDYINYPGAGTASASGSAAGPGAYGVTGPVSAGGRGNRGGYTITHPPPPTQEVDVDVDMDADADGELDAEGERDDKPYCFCQMPSYGEMIGCDNDECPYEWVRPVSHSIVFELSTRCKLVS